METNPYESPHSPNEPSASEMERDSRRIVFAFLGTATLAVWIISVVICVSVAEIVALAAFLPIGLLGAFAVWHGVKPSKNTVRLLVAALAILALEAVLLATVFS